jgi:hypothetical protein
VTESLSYLLYVISTEKYRIASLPGPDKDSKHSASFYSGNTGHLMEIFPVSRIELKMIKEHDVHVTLCLSLSSEKGHRVRIRGLH